MSKRIDDIEILRAVAVLLVVVEHAHGHLVTWKNDVFDFMFFYLRGGSAVDLFFAISGFVIARELIPRIRQCGTGGEFLTAVVSFWTKRAWRILPSAWLWLAIVLLASAAFNTSRAFGSFDATVAGAIAAVFQFYNLHFAHCLMRYDCGANFVYWSLSLEEQFYMLLPLVVFVSRRWLVPILIVAISLQMFSPRSLLMLGFRSDALLLGVLIAWWSGKPGFSAVEARLIGNSRFMRLLVGGGLIVVLVAAAADQWVLATYRFGIVSLISATLVLFAAFDRGYFVPLGGLKEFLLWVGSRSYAIYLVHVPAYFATREIWFRIEPENTVFGANHALPFILTATVLILTMAEINYRLLEMPLRRRGAAIAARVSFARVVQGRH